MAIKCTYRQLAALRDQTDREGSIVVGPMSKLNKVDEQTVTSIVDRVRIARFIKAIITETVEYEKTHLELLKKYGVQDEKNKAVYIIPPDKREDYHTEMKKLEEQEVEVNVVPLPSSVIEKVSLTVGDLAVLEPFVLFPAE
jgi:hypothetical protein